jgi:hypothetical protein
MTTRTKKTSRTYRTIGAISGHFPSAAERAANAAIASESVGAQQERAVEAAEIQAAASRYLGQCPRCGSHVSTGSGAASLDDCRRCAMYRAEPDRWYIDEDGTWSAR